MTYDEAKEVVKKLFIGINQPVATVYKALDVISERDYYRIQAEYVKKMRKEVLYEF